MVSGEKADDPLYITAIDQVRQNVGRSGLFYVCDSKMMSMETRLHLAAGGDTYLGPFPKVQILEEALTILLEPVWSGEQPLESVERNGVKIAKGFESSVLLKGKQGEKEVEWTERRLSVCSLQHAKVANQAFEERLAQTEHELSSLNERGRGKEHFRNTKSLEQAALAVIEKHKVTARFQEHLPDHHPNCRPNSPVHHATHCCSEAHPGNLRNARFALQLASYQSPKLNLK